MMFANKIKDQLNNQTLQDIAAELVALLYNQARPAILGSLIVATFLVYGLYNVISNQVLFSWYGLMCSVTILRYMLVMFYFKDKNSHQHTQFWKTAFIFMTTVAGFSWSLAGTVLIPAGNSAYQTLIACSLAGVSSGAVPFFSGSRLACAGFVVPLLLPFAGWLMLQNDISHHVLGALIFFYLGLLLISSNRTHKAIYHAVKLKFENIELVKNLNTEINERELAEKLLKSSEEQYRLVTDALPVLISYIDNDMHFRFNNKAYETWFGKSVHDITGKQVKEIFGHTAFSIFAEYSEKLAEKRQITYETILKFHEEDERYVSVTLIAHVEDNVMRGIFSLISDMTPRINYLATHDSLTDLPNRSLFNARFSRALKQAERDQSKLALLFLDLDHFKKINDTLGHDVGDQLLVKVAERLKNCLRATDTFARLGGDEFTILLEKISSAEVIAIAIKLRDQFMKPFILNGREIFITTSTGISIYPEDGNDMQILLKNADMTIYRAKEGGRNTFEFYTRELNDVILKKLNIENKLRTALERQELIVYYQPIVGTTHLNLASFEVLLRWENPELGFVLPSEFVSIAEEMGLIVQIGEWVLRQACMQNVKWLKDKALPFPSRLSINLSARQVRENNCIDMIKNVLNETGLSGEFLTLELTEGLIMQDIGRSATLMRQIKDLGIAISIDDFGTGYSSLNYLRRFPIDVLKIDRSFITDVITNSEDALIVNAIIAMAHSLKMKVVAEGVETLEQFQFLRDRDCDEIQGYLIAPPMPVHQLSDFLQKPIMLDELLKAKANFYHDR